MVNISMEDSGVGDRKDGWMGEIGDRSEGRVNAFLDEFQIFVLTSVFPQMNGFVKATVCI